jgi:hypothetical protein
MNVEIGTVAAQFLFSEHLFQFFGIGSLQCVLGAYEQLPFLGVNSVVSGKICLIVRIISFDTGLFLPFVPALLNLMHLHSVSSSKINSRFYLLIITQQTYLSSN